MDFTSIQNFRDHLGSEKYKKLLQTEIVFPFFEKLDNTLLILKQAENLIDKIDSPEVFFNFDKINKSINEYKRTQNPQDLNDISKANDELLNFAYSSLSISLKKYSQKIASILEQQKALETTVKKCEESVDNTIKDATYIKEKYQKQFDEFIRRTKQLTDDYQKNIDSDRDKFKKDSDSHLGEMINFIEKKKIEWNKLIENLEEQTAKYSNGINDLNNKLQIATYGIQSSAYLKASASEQKFADTLRIIALSLMIIIAIIVATITIVGQYDEDTPYSIAFRFIFIFSLMIPAGYSSKESARHRARSEYFRIRGMEILALENYVSDMPKEEALLIKKRLVEKYFGATNMETDTQASGTTDILDLLSKVTEALKNASGKTENTK